MRHRSRLARSAWLAFAAFQLLLPGAAALADASLDIAGEHARPHIESHSTATCARVHPSDCALCRFLTTALVAGASTTVPTSGSAPFVVLPVALRHPASAVVLLPRSRAPPTLA